MQGIRQCGAGRAIVFHGMYPDEQHSRYVLGLEPSLRHMFVLASRDRTHREPVSISEDLPSSYRRCSGRDLQTLKMGLRKAACPMRHAQVPMRRTDSSRAAISRARGKNLAEWPESTAPGLSCHMCNGFGKS